MKVRHFLAHSYLFWLFFSLLNFDYFWFLSVPLLPLLGVPVLLNSFHFLWQPVVFAIASSAVLTLGSGFLLRRRWQSTTLTLSLLIYLFNGMFVFVLVAKADQERAIAMSAQLMQRNPSCIQLNTFFTSLKNAGNPFVAHGLFEEKGKTFYWSYSTMSFFEGNEALDRNFPCARKAPAQTLR